MGFSSTSFRKGEVPNPKGRPKGSEAAHTKVWRKVKGLAIKDFDKAYARLWKAIEAGESWAHNLYFKELVPRKAHLDTVLVDSHHYDFEHRVNNLVKALGEFKLLTHNEVLNEIKVLSIIKVASQAKSNPNLFDMLTDKKLDQILAILEEDGEVEKDC